MKKLVIMVLCCVSLLFASALFAFEMPPSANWVSTIKGTTIEDVRNTAIELFVDALFDVKDSNANSVQFSKMIPEIFVNIFHVVTINMVQKNDDVKIMVNQKMMTSGGGVGQRTNIEHLVPMLKELKHRLDGTPYDRIENEVTTLKSRDEENKAKGNTAQMVFKNVGTTKKEEKPRFASSGLVFDKQLTAEGFLMIREVAEGSPAQQAGLRQGDAVTEINLAPVKLADGVEGLKSIDDRLMQGRSVILGIRRGAENLVVTLKN